MMCLEEKLNSVIDELKTCDSNDDYKYEQICYKMANLMLDNEDEAAKLILNFEDESDLTWLSNCLLELVSVRRSEKIINAFKERKKTMKDPQQIHNIKVDFEFAEIYED